MGFYGVGVQRGKETIAFKNPKTFKNHKEVKKQTSENPQGKAKGLSSLAKASLRWKPKRSRTSAS